MGNANSAPGAPPSSQRKSKLLLVMGETGDGKTTLIRKLRDPTDGGLCEAGEDKHDETKNVTRYRALPIGGQHYDLIDTPGVGGETAGTVCDLVKMIKAAVTQPIDGLIVTHKIYNGRNTLGLTIMQTLLEHGVMGISKQGSHWENVILCGTMRDLAEKCRPQAIDNFVLDKSIVKENGNPKGLVASFFQDAPDKWGNHAMIHHQDLSQLRNAIVKLPNTQLMQADSDVHILTTALAKTLHLDLVAATTTEIEARYQDELEVRDRDIQRKLQDQKRRNREWLESARKDAEKQYRQEKACLMEERQRMQEQRERQQREDEKRQRQQREELERIKRQQAAECRRLEMEARKLELERQHRQAELERQRKEQEERQRW